MATFKSVGSFIGSTIKWAVIGGLAGFVGAAIRVTYGLSSGSGAYQPGIDGQIYANNTDLTSVLECIQAGRKDCVEFDGSVDLSQAATPLFYAVTIGTAVGALAGVGGGLVSRRRMHRYEIVLDEEAGDEFPDIENPTSTKSWLPCLRR